MIRFAVIQHTYSEFLGLIERQLERRDIGFIYIRPFVGQHVPSDVGQFDALFLLGGKAPPTDRETAPWVDDEISLIRQFQKAERPVVGIGFGGMLVAQAAGAEVSSEPFHSAYWATGRATGAGKGDALARAVDGRRLLVMANGSARLSKGIEPIVVDEDGNWLAIRTDKLTYGMLFRPEFKPGMIEDMVMEANRSVPENIAELLATARAEWTGMQDTTDRVIGALVKELDLMRERRKVTIIPITVGGDDGGARRKA